MAKAKQDNKVLTLINEIKSRKAEIKAIESPKWKTTLLFKYQEDVNNVLNLHTVNNVETLVKVAAYLRMMDNSYSTTHTQLVQESSDTKMTWQGFTVSDWIHDITLRIHKLQLKEKISKLENLESRLNSIVSPELRAKMELEAIEAELK